MLTKTRFLTGFATLLFGRAKRSGQAVLRQWRKELYENSVGEISAQLAEEIPPELVEKHASIGRSRIYSHPVTFWAFLTQVFSEDASCSMAVARVQQWCRQLKLPAPSPNTESFVEARQRLPEEMLQGIHAIYRISSPESASTVMPSRPSMSLPRKWLAHHRVRQSSCRLDRQKYPTGRKVTKEKMARVNMIRNKFHGEWNYVIKPTTMTN